MSSLPDGPAQALLVAADSESAASVPFSSVQGSLGLFAEAIAGRPVLIEAESERVGWPWRARPVLPSVSSSASLGGTASVMVPAVLDVHDSPQANRLAGRAIILHQLMVRASAEPDGSPTGGQLGVIFALVEDLRVDAVTRREFPGAVADLNALLALARAEPDSGESDDSDGEGGEGGGGGLFDALRVRALSGTRAELASRFTNVDSVQLDFLVAETAAVLEPGATPTVSLVVARRLNDLLGTGAFPLASLAEDLDENEPTTQAPSSESGGGVSSSSATPTEFEDGEGVSHGQATSDGASAVATDSTDEPASTGLTVESAAARSERAPRSFFYDEWDYLQARHRPAWCRVVEEILVGTNHEFIGDVRQRHRELRAGIRRSFGRLRPTDLVRMYRRDDGDEVDLDAAIEARIDRRSGAPADDRLHIRRDRGARDVATAFLIDLSASTSSPAVAPEQAPVVPDPDPYEDVMSYAPVWGSEVDAEPARRVIDVALEAVALMSDALHELGDRHALYGFSGTGRNSVEFKVAKDFNDRVSPSTWAALAAMKPLRYTRMGPAIRHATTKLSAQTARTRLLIVISDGYPQDVDYGDDPRDRDYGVQDTARALADAARAGIDTFCVTIDPAGHDYLRAMTPENRYLVIDDVEVLPEVLPQLYLTLAGG